MLEQKMFDDNNDNITDVEFINIVEHQKESNDTYSNNSEDIEKKQTKKPEYLLLIEWIENNPRYRHLIDIIDGKLNENKVNKVDKITNQIKNIMFSNPEEYYGKSYVTDKVKQDAVVVSRLVNFSNLLDAVGNAPLWFFAFKSIGNIPAFFISIIISAIILSFTNDLSTAINRKSQKSSFLETLGAFSALIILNIIQSFATGIGAELFNNQAKLSQIQATNIVEKQFILRNNQVENIKNNPSPRYLEVKKQCENGEKELNQLSTNNPRWDSLYVNLYGLWQEKNKNWAGYDVSQIPVCIQMNMMREEVFIDYENAQKNYNNLLLLRSETSNDLIFLQDNFPNVYQLHFTSNGDINSGLELVTLATENFLNKLFAGNFSEITLSLFIMSLSFITSFVACLYTWFYAQNQDVKLSWDEELRYKRDLWLEQQWRDYNSDID